MIGTEAKKKGRGTSLALRAALCGITVWSAQGAFAQAPEATDKIRFQVPGRDFAAHPPAIRSMYLFRAAASPQGNARLEVVFREALPAVVAFNQDGETRELRDDGQGEDARAFDGIYSARVRAADADFAAIPAVQERFPDFVQLSAQERGGTALIAPRTAEAVASGAVSAAAVNPAYLVDPEKALIIRNTNVLNHYFRTTDPCKNVATPAGANPPPPDSAKKWSFGYLMTQMANSSSTKITTSDFALKWLDEWAKTQTVNGDPLMEVERANGPKIAPTVKAQWLAASGNTGKVKMGKAPFRLLAIVNRLDKRGNPAFNGGSAGELRFVFGILDLTHREPDGQCASMGQPKSLGDGAYSSESTVILEFAVDKATQTDIKAWGQKWIDLNAKTQDSPEYRTALEAITESVVKAGVGNAKSRANGSALLVIRTNESNDNNVWDLREFAIDKTSHLLKAATVAQTPAASLNENTEQVASPTLVPPEPGYDQSRDLLLWSNAKADSILADRHVMPKTFPTNTGVTYEHANLLGSHALTNMVPWSFSSNVDPELRHHLALNTCNGCHATEGVGSIGSGAVFHIEGRAFANRAKLSHYLTGAADDAFGTAPYMAADVVFGTPSRPFAELEKRRQDLAALMSGTTLSSLAFQPLTQTH